MTPSTYDAVDLCGGPGGWDVGARELGLNVLGIELSHDACQTRRAAGLATLEGDVRAFGPGDFLSTDGLIASPPCQPFSIAGKGSGRRALDDVLHLVKALSVRENIAESGRVFEDDRTALVVEPLRWALAAVDQVRPFQWLAFEQVPTVLPVWEAIADVLRVEGYSVETGVLSAEQFGVPQTRKRAFLVARNDGRRATLPTPTHSRFHVRDPERLDADLLPWVSMGEALGWPASFVGFPRRADRDSDVIELNGEQYRGRDLRPSLFPAFALTEKARSWQRWQLRNNTSANACVRRGDQPAGTLYFGRRLNTMRWESVDGTAEPVRITVDEALTLQSFAPGYPLHGSQTSAFHQIGNAVPPRLGRAVLAEITKELR